MEDIELNKLYSISINPRCEPSHMAEDKKRYKATVISWYRKFLDELLPFEDLDFEIHIECSPTGRWHFHGTILVRSRLNLVMFLNKVDATYEIDTINDEEVWKNYISKQDALWNEELFKVSCVKTPYLVNTNNRTLKV